MNDPDPAQESKEHAAQRIFTQRADFYATSPVHIDRAVLDQLADWTQAQPHWLALDVATGTGHTAFAIAPRVRSVIATDLTAAMLTQAVRLADERAIRNVSLAAADAHVLPFADATFDLVTSRRAPHHFSRIAVALAEFRRVTKPGGRLVIDDRSVPEDDFTDETMNRLDWYHDESHVRQYGPSEWERMLSAAGFTVERSELYSKSLPLTSLTNDVAPDRVEQMHAILRECTPLQRDKLGLVERDGRTHINHWYVMIAAVCLEPLSNKPPSVSVIPAQAGISP